MPRANKVASANADLEVCHAKLETRNPKPGSKRDRGDVQDRRGVPHWIFTGQGGKIRYLGCFFAKLTLAKMLIAAMPAKKMTDARRPPPETCPARNRMAPTTRLKSAQTTFTIGEDKPFPGGLANGVGNGSPDTPFTK